MLVLLIIAVIATVASGTDMPRTPPSKPPDINQVIESCMTSGHRVGECMSRISREA